MKNADKYYIEHVAIVQRVILKSDLKGKIMSKYSIQDLHEIIESKKCGNDESVHLIPIIEQLIEALQKMNGIHLINFDDLFNS